jgi:biopolymer transport protein TolQ
MENTIIDSVTLGGSVAATNFSAWGLFIQADWIVKLVIIVLFLASIWCWAIIVEKYFRLRRLQRSAGRFEDVFWSGGSLDDLFEQIGQRPVDPMSAVFSSAMREWRRSLTRRGNGGGVTGNLQERIDRVMHVTVGREMERLEKHMAFLASVGSTAPFIGLFGTVWGIINSFQSIAAAKQTTLAIVAPGIAEALFATALGLVAAIPAVIAYNKLSTDLNRYAGRLEAFSSEFSAILSRQIDEAA